MRSTTIIRVRTLSAVLATAAGLALATAAAAAIGHEPAEPTAASLRLAQYCRTYGPFATIRRANEVAYRASGGGQRTLVFHNGDGYYMRVC